MTVLHSCCEPTAFTRPEILNGFPNIPACVILIREQEASACVSRRVSLVYPYGAREFAISARRQAAPQRTLPQD
jgi:hypothetical protein